MIDIQHQADDMLLVTPGASQLLVQPHLEVPAVVPAGQYVGKTAAQQPRPVDGVIDAGRRDDPEVCEKIDSVLARVSLRISAAEVDAADQPLVPCQRDHCDAFQPVGLREDELVITGRKGTEPGASHRRILRRESSQ